MGRQAKIRKQRAAGNTNSEEKPTQAATQDSKSSRSLWDKVRNFFSASNSQAETIPNPDSFNQDYSQENLRLLGAVAWEGYQSQRRGFVLVVAQSDTSPQPTYIPRPSLRKTLRAQGISSEDIKTINQLVSEYEPRKAAVLVYIDRDGAISISNPTLKPTPPECYELLNLDEA
ncbi:MAG: hypothetical protein ACLFV6_10300 [Spirulinaceae cyanobacterium]